MGVIHVPAVQHWLGSRVSVALHDKLGTKVDIGSVNLGFLNRLVIDDVTIFDQQNKKMLQASRLSAKIDVLPLLFDKQIRVSSAQLFGLNADLYKASEQSKTNFQFVLDSLASKKDTTHTPLDLSIQSLVIRHGTVKYNQLDAPVTPGKFNTRHIHIKELSSHIILNQLTDDSVSVNVKKLSLQESSGFNLQSLSFLFNASNTNRALKDFRLRLPNTDIRIDEIKALYQKDQKPSLLQLPKDFQVNINKSSLTPSDIACFVSQFKDFNGTIFFNTHIHGNEQGLYVDHLQANSSNGLIGIKGNGYLGLQTKSPQWRLHINDMKLSAEGIQFVVKNLNGKRASLPEELTRIGNINFKGNASGNGDNITLRGDLLTSVGDLKCDMEKRGSHLIAKLQSKGINLGRIMNDNKLGDISTDITLFGTQSLKSRPIPFSTITAKGNISHFLYNGYAYRNIKVDGNYSDGTLNGVFTLDDPQGFVELQGMASVFNKTPKYDLTVKARHLNPHALKVTNALGNHVFDFDLKANVTGNKLETAYGTIDLQNFSMNSAKDNFHINHLHVETGNIGQQHFLDLQSDYGSIHIKGKYDYKTLPQSFTNLIANELPTIPGLPKATKSVTNNFTIDADIMDGEWARKLLGIPIELHQPIYIDGTLNDNSHQIDMCFSLPDVSYDDNRFKNCYLKLLTANDSLFAHAYMEKTSETGHPMTMDINAKADDDKLNTTIKWDTHGEKPLNGVLNTNIDFFRNEKHEAELCMNILPSEIGYKNSKWLIHPAQVTYTKNQLSVNNFELSNDQQRLLVNGRVTNSPNDSIKVDLKNVDVEYILNLVNFHSVDFAGLASGQAYVKNIFNSPNAWADIKVHDFRFENGKLGTLHALANFQADEGQINIDANATDLENGKTYVEGYVSPKKNFIDLSITADNSKLDFMENFCGSFMENVKARGKGKCWVFGDLKAINLEGGVIANGDIDIKTLNTTYTLRNDTIKMIPDEIIFEQDSIFDINGNHAIVSGALHHKNLSKMTFDINFDAQNFLSYDFNDYGENIFYGKVLATGNCYIKGRRGEITFDVNATPQKGSFIEYNAASPEGINNGEFIHWKKPLSTTSTANDSIIAPLSNGENADDRPTDNITTNIRMNFLVNATPDFTVRILMDKNSGDYIALHGNGIIRANYFNKGSFDMFGNYLIDDGIYKLTIQNVIKKDFQFQSGSTIIFGGDPFNALLNMKGVYTINSVSLSDLQVGNSFRSNNVKVNCLMNIGGTAGSPNVTFGLDMPTLNQDAQQMIQSLLNSDEDMNQQVLYLLAVGRFLPPGANNASEESTQQTQASLAMQSILSGTISQQINTVLSNVVKSSNWNFGANISTGDEGFNNAEYEGLLSGRLLNNRLLINGQFGFRDNVNTSNGSNFIGDFDVQYLLVPSGNLAVKVYNQTNDRYFTRNSLYKQGIGVIMKKDFTNLSDLLGKKKKKKK